MSHSSAPVDVDPATLETSQRIWHGFTTVIKYGVIHLVVLLLLMAVFLT